MTEFAKRYGNEPWFIKAQNYLIARRSVIQARLENTFRFVELSKDNGSAFSYEFASILRDAGSVFGSVLDALVKGYKGDPNLKTYFKCYRELLMTYDPDIPRRSVQVRALFPGGLVLPLTALARGKAPSWWEAYNRIKHSEYDNLQSGNMRNAVLAVAALVILEHFMGTFPQDSLWVNIGMVYPEDSIDMSPERILFRD